MIVNVKVLDVEVEISVDYSDDTIKFQFGESWSNYTNVWWFSFDNFYNFYSSFTNNKYYNCVLTAPYSKQEYKFDSDFKLYNTSDSVLIFDFENYKNAFIFFTLVNHLALNVGK